MLRARGASLLPAIGPGDLFRITEQPFESVPHGDVVAFTCGTRLFLHRASGRSGDGSLLTSGTTSRSMIPPCAATTIWAWHAMSPHSPGGPRTSTRCGWPWAHSVRQMHRPGGDRAQPGNREVGSASSASVRIAISRAGALPGMMLRRLLADCVVRNLPVDMLIGFDFGRPGVTADGVRVLPPDAAHFHVRLGEPWQPVPADTALAIVRDDIKAVLGGGSVPTEIAERVPV